MSAREDALIESIVAESIAAHPLPEQYSDLNPQSRRYVERQAAHAGLTPETYYARSLARRELSESDLYRARIRDESERRTAVERLADTLGDLDNILGHRVGH